jgi:serpin B
MINKWVEDKTENKIKNLIQPGMLGDLTRLVLVNALYFKGNWKIPFNAGRTKDEPFFVSPEKSIHTPMMMNRFPKSFRHAEFDTLQILELPYMGNELSMLVLLPRKTHGLKQLESSLSAENLEKWKSHLNRKEVLVYLPRFKMTSTFRLGKTLESMGMVDAFSETRANFKGMDGHSDWLCLAAVIHKAFVEVNEAGTEAAAATAAILTTMGDGDFVLFRADHPFLFLIQEIKTGTILFIGRVTDPTKTGG